MCMVLKWLIKVTMFMGQYQVDLIWMYYFWVLMERQKRKEKGSSFGWLGQVGSHADSVKIEDKDGEALR